MSKKAQKPHYSTCVEKELLNIVNEDKMNTLLVGNIDSLTRSDCYIDALMQHIFSNKSLITALERFVKCHVEKSRKKAENNGHLKKLK